MCVVRGVMLIHWVNESITLLPPPPATYFQLAVVPEYNIFLGLSDSEVFFADLDGFQMRGQIPRSKGANYFAVDWQKLRGIYIIVCLKSCNLQCMSLVC